MPQNAPDFIPAEASPDFIPAAEQTPKKQQPSLWQNVKGIFNPPLPQQAMDSGENPMLGTPLGTKTPIREGASEASSVASLGLGLGRSPMGMPEPNMSSIGLDAVGKGLQKFRLRAPEPTEAEKLQASIDRSMARRAGMQAAKEKVEGIPAQSMTESPNYPKLLAARGLARQSAREALETKMQTGSAPRISKSGVLRLPEPREALPTDTPGYLSSIPRERLPGLAMQGYPGAGELLRNLGKQVIYMPPEDYPGPRVTRLPRPFVLPSAAD